MVKSVRCRTPRIVRPPYRLSARRVSRRLYHSCLGHFAGYRRGPDALSEALTAFTRAVRAHRRLAKLAPEFFDSTIIYQLEQLRKDDADWRRIWEPSLNRVYASEPTESTPDLFAHIPPLPKARARASLWNESSFPGAFG